MGWLRGSVEEEQIMRMKGLCSLADKMKSASSRGICCEGSTTRQRMMACPRWMNARCVDVNLFLESVSIAI